MMNEQDRILSRVRKMLNLANDALTAVHGDGKRRLKFEFRPTTWISHAVQAACGIQYHKLLPNGHVRPGLYYKGWRWNVQKACMRLQSFGNRWV